MENRRDDESRKEIIGIWIIEYLLTIYNIYIYKIYYKISIYLILNGSKKKKSFDLKHFRFLYSRYIETTSIEKGEE